MIEFQGKNGRTARVMIDNIDETTAAQIQSIVVHPAMMKSPVIMPDCHAGKGCVVGYTCELEDDDKIIPNLIGVDIACGMRLAKFPKLSIDMSRFDRHVKQNIPMGFNTRRDKANLSIGFTSRLDSVAKLIGAQDYLDRFSYSVGSLGGGNHFIELDEDEENIYAIIHSGSRNFGKMIAEHFQRRAVISCGGAYRPQNCSGQGFKAGVPEEQAWLSDKHDIGEYIYSMNVATEYASLNRQTMMEEILKYFSSVHNVSPIEMYECVHNYIDFNDRIVRKGAISAHMDEKVIIPMNMRDGVILGVGLGNLGWNCSAPHGAGRVLSRAQAKKNIKLEDFRDTMKGVYSSTINQDTIDESPFAYKSAEMIQEAITDTVKITSIVKPIYNVKSGKD